MMLRPELPVELDDLVVGRLLAKSRSARPRDAAEVLALLDEVEAPASTSFSPPSLRQREITAAERRVLAMVLVRVATAATAAATGAGTVVMEATRERAIADLSRRHQGRADVLADGGAVVTLEGRGAATDRAVRAARCALAVREALPDAAMVVAFAVADAARRAAMGEIIDRSVSLLDAAAAAGGEPAVRLEPGIAAVLEGRFDITTDALSAVPRGERDSVVAGRTLLGKPTPCVGREHEIARLAATRRPSAPTSRASGCGSSRTRSSSRRVPRAASPAKRSSPSAARSCVTPRMRRSPRRIARRGTCCAAARAALGGDETWIGPIA